MTHIVLLGDSIFDNESYVPVGKPVIRHLESMLPSGSRATLLAVDGDVVESVFEQLKLLPSDATHLVLSVGGNDALGVAAQLFGIQSQTVSDALAKAYEIVEKFGASYERLISRLTEFQLPLTACTIYDNVPGLGTWETAGLTLFNDAITRTVFASRAKLIDLRLLCNEASDYSEVSPIEPSHTGGQKIAQAIVQACLGGSSCSEVIGTASTILKT